jgi:hypothetical protein
MRKDAQQIHELAEQVAGDASKPTGLCVSVDCAAWQLRANGTECPYRSLSPGCGQPVRPPDRRGLLGKRAFPPGERIDDQRRVAEPFAIQRHVCTVGHPQLPGPFSLEIRGTRSGPRTWCRVSNGGTSGDRG